MTFWDNFTRVCVLRGISPTTICKKIGLSNATATHWKQGALPKADALAAVCEVLDCSADYLIGRSDKVTAGEPELSPLESRLLSAFREMSPEEQYVLIGRAEQEADREKAAKEKEAI